MPADAGAIKDSGAVTDAADKPAPPPPYIDDCTQDDTMTNPRLVGAPSESAGNTVVRIAWDAGDGIASALPKSYFAQVTLEKDSIVTAATMAGEREMDVTLTGSPSAYAGKTEKLTLSFPDRRDFVKCVHQGMDDVYKLIVTLTFSADGTSATGTFEQSIQLGAI